MTFCRNLQRNKFGYIRKQDIQDELEVGTEKPLLWLRVA